MTNSPKRRPRRRWRNESRPATQRFANPCGSGPISLLLLLPWPSLCRLRRQVGSYPRRTPALRKRTRRFLSSPGHPDRGRIVFAAADCSSCHASPGQTDRLRLGGRLALASPFGTFRVPNISPDPDVGIGRWRTIDLANALLSGVAPSGQHLYLALPYTSYAGMRGDDIRDLMAFLRTLHPVV